MRLLHFGRLFRKSRRAQALASTSQILFPLMVRFVRLLLWVALLVAVLGVAVFGGKVSAFGGKTSWSSNVGARSLGIA